MITTREAWLIAATDAMRPWFADAGYTLPGELRLSIGFPSKSALSSKKKRIGECWYATTSQDGYHHLFISPLLGDPIEVLAVLVHELGHVVVGAAGGHKAPFKAMMAKLGLEGKATATVAGDALRARLNALLMEIGNYPHGALNHADLKGKTQTTRLLKAQCPSGDTSGGKLYTVRITAVHLDSLGPPICPKCLQRMVNDQGEPFNDDEGDNDGE